MYPYQVLADATKKYVLEGKGRHNKVGGHSCVLSRVPFHSTSKYKVNRLQYTSYYSISALT